MRPDHRISIPAAAWAKSVLAAARAATIAHLGAGIAQHATAAGRSLRRTSTPSFLARIVSGPPGGPYAFRGVFWRDGDWVDRTSANDPGVAYQANLQDVPDDKIVRMFPVGIPGEYRFLTPKEGGMSFDGCPCMGMPTTLRCLDPVFGEIALVHVGGSFWYACRQVMTVGVNDSNEIVDVSTKYYYKFSCVGGAFHLSVVYRGRYNEDLFVVVDPGTGGVGGCGGTNFGTNVLNYPMESECLPYLGHEDPAPGGDARPFDLTAFGVSGTAADFNNAMNSGVLSASCSPFCVNFRGADYSHNVLTANSSPDGTFTLFRTGYDYRPDLGVHCGAPGYFGLLDPSPADFNYHVFDGLGFLDRRFDFMMLDPAADPPEEGAGPCIVVHKAPCGGVPGDPIEGAEVKVYRTGEATLLATITTGVDGRACYAATDWGAYTFVATKNGCVGTARKVFGPCSGAVEDAVIVLCCATACVLVLDDGEETDTPVVGATVAGGGLDWPPTDAEGKSCVFLTTQQMLALPVVGGDCTVRRLAVAVTKVDVDAEPPSIYLERCADIVVSCGDDGSTPTEVRMARFPNGYLRGGCCPDDGCETTGPLDRGLVPEEPDTDLQIVTRDVGGTVTNTFRYTGPLGIDQGAFDDDGVTTYDSGCQAPTIAPLYDDGVGNFVPYLSCVVRVELCRGEGIPVRVRVRIFRGAGCPGFTDWDSTVGPDDLDYDWELPEGAGPLCYGEEIDEAEEFEGDNDSWSLSMVPP